MAFDGTRSGAPALAQTDDDGVTLTEFELVVPPSPTARTKYVYVVPALTFVVSEYVSVDEPTLAIWLPLRTMLYVVTPLDAIQFSRTPGAGEFPERSQNAFAISEKSGGGA